MAEQFDASPERNETETTPDVPSARRSLLRRPAAKTPATRRTARVHPVRSFITLTAVAGMVATVAIPAFAAVDRGSSAEAVTLQQVAAEDAQSLVVASQADPAVLERDSYAATTPEEIEKAKAEERAKAALAKRLAAGSSASVSATSGSVPLVAPGSGLVRRPLAGFNNFGTPYAGHKGTDYMVGAGAGIYSVADGVVVASSESGPGWGVYVKIAHNINGTNVTSLYAHMTSGSRRVSVGDTVSAGQLIGQVGSTGRANGAHLHLEIRVNGGYTNAESWLQANAG